jgi:phosphoribosylamine--glycine ligase
MTPLGTTLKHLNPCHGRGKRIIVIGNGGREDALRWKLEKHDHCIVEGLADLTVVGPEKEIAGGIADRHAHKHIVAPSMLAARLESSKLWAKQFMQRHDIPTARWMTYTRSPDGMNQAIFDMDNMRDDHTPVVIKEDGLCGGKGVIIAKSKQEAWSHLPHIFTNNVFNSPSNKVLFEDFIEGFEASCFVMSDGENYKMLPFCKDHKRLGDGDTGPNTGGMGAYCPHPGIDEKLAKEIETKIVFPTLNGMRLEGLRYKGILYVGLMISKDGPYVIEYNVRFGDPECQVLMMLMEDDLYPYLKAITNGTLDKLPEPKFKTGAAVTVTLCSQGYPQEYVTGHEITGLDDLDDVVVFHAGTELNENTGKYKTTGGRVLNVTALGETVDQASEKVYNAIHKIDFANMIYRTDIGKNEENNDTNKAAKWNQRRRGRNNTEQCRKKFKNHSHFRRADLLSRS